MTPEQQAIVDAELKALADFKKALADYAALPASVDPATRSAMLSAAIAIYSAFVAKYQTPAA